MPISIFASSYLSELRSVRHRLAEIINSEGAQLALHSHSTTVEWAYQVVDDLIREVESGTPSILRAAQSGASEEVRLGQVSGDESDDPRGSRGVHK